MEELTDLFPLLKHYPKRMTCSWWMLIVHTKNALISTYIQMFHYIETEQFHMPEHQVQKKKL